MAPQRAVWPLQARVSALSGSPAARAFSLGYTATVLPTLLKIVLGALLSRNKPSAKRGSEVARLLVDAIVKGFSPTGMATACAIALGGGAWGESRVELLVRKAYLATLQRLRARKGQGKNTKPGQSREEIKARATVHEKRIQALSTLLATTFSSLVAITVLQSSPAYARSRTAPIEKDQTLRSQTDDELEVPFVASPYPQLFAPDDDSVLDASSTVPTTRTRRPENFAVQQSPTLHISLFMLVRALDSVVRGLYELRPVTVATPRVLKLVASHADTLVFGLSCWRIMWCWFYLPSRLPSSYVKWIARLARMDPRLLAVLRYARADQFVYGVKPSAVVEKTCEGIAASMNLDARAANPFYHPRLDCTIVHGKMGTESCEVNAAKRFGHAFVDSLMIYGPVHLIPHLLFSTPQFINSPVASILKVAFAAGRSSAFLATFVGSIYASVCLVRTRLGPYFFSQQLLDSGLCAGLGCFLCGFSVLIENKRRRREMAIYVAPNALYSLMSEAVSSGPMGEFLSRWIERTIFSLSTGIVTTTMVYRPDLVSGVVRGVMSIAVKGWKSGKQLS